MHNGNHNPDLLFDQFVRGVKDTKLYITSKQRNKMGGLGKGLQLS